MNNDIEQSLEGVKLNAAPVPGFLETPLLCTDSVQHHQVIPLLRGLMSCGRRHNAVLVAIRTDDLGVDPNGYTIQNKLMNKFIAIYRKEPAA